jgi:hypothetical protein
VNTRRPALALQMPSVVPSTQGLRIGMPIHVTF